MKAKENGIVTRINGPIVHARNLAGVEMYEVVYVGALELVGEVVRIENDRCVIQVYEDPTGIKPGDPIVPICPFTEMANKKYLMAKAHDNRFGCAMFMDVIAELKNRKHPNTVYGVGTVQEEVGLRGAKTAAAVVDPDVAICLDVGLAGDIPGDGGDDANKLGEGPQISLYDNSMIPNLALRDLFVKTAKRLKIPFQYQVMAGGGTDANTPLNRCRFEQGHHSWTDR